MQRSSNERRRCTPLQRSTTAVLVGLLVAVVAAGAVLVPVAAADPGGDTIYVDDDWSDNSTGDTVGDGYVIDTNASATLSGGLSLADPGDTVVVHDGEYTPDSSVTISDAGVSLVGESESGVVIDGSNLSGHDDPWTGAWTVYVAEGADDVTLNGFTVVNAPHDAVKANFVEGLTVEDVTVSGSVLSEMDLNNVRDATIADVTLSGDDTKGVGLALSGVENVTVDGITTSGNTWGGVGVFTTTTSQTGGSPDGWTFINTPKDVTVRNGDFGELVNVYTEDGDSHTVDPAELDGPAFDYAVAAPEYRDGDFTFYAASSGDAVDVAAADQINGFAVGNGTTVQERATGDYLVGDGMSIQDAVDTASDGDTVLVEPGTYQEHLTLDVQDLALEAAGARDDTTLTSDGTTLDITAANVTVEGFTVETTTSSGNLVGLGGANYSLVGNVLDATSGAVAAYGKADDGTLRNNVVKAAGTSNYAVRLGDADGALVADNEFEQAAVPSGSGNTPQSLLVASVTNTTVRDNEFAGPASGQAVLVTTNAGPVDNLTIRDNQVTGYAQGVFLYGDASAMSNVDVVDNDVDGVTGRAIRALDASGSAEFTALNDEDAAAAQSDALLATNDVGAVSVNGVLSSSDTVTVAPDGSGDFATIQSALDSVEPGTTVQLAEGTYEVATDNADGRLANFPDGVTLTGAGEGDTVIEASAQWGVYVSETDNVTLSEFTVVGVDDGWGSATVKADYNENLTIQDVTVESGYIGFDLNNVRDATLRDVAVTDHSAVGLSLKGTEDLLLDGLTTTGSPWGGVGIYPEPDTSGGPEGWEDIVTPDDITIQDHTSVNEPVPVYTQSTEQGDIGDLRLADATHVVENPNHKPESSDEYDDYFALYQYSQSDATSYAADDTEHADATTSTVRTLERDDTGAVSPSDTYVVSPAMSAHAALDQAASGSTVLLLDGTHDLATGLDVDTDGLTVRGQSTSGTVLDASAVPGRAIETPSGGEVSGLTVADLTVVGPQQGNTGNYALKFQPTTEDVTVRNVIVEGAERTGIDFNGVRGVLVADTIVADSASGNGIGLTDTRNVTVRNATLTNNAWGGVALYTSTYAAEQGTYNVTIEESTIADTGAGVYAQNSGGVADPFRDVTVRDNTFADTGVHVAGIGDAELAWFDYEDVLSSNDFDSLATVRDADGDLVPTGEYDSGALHGELGSAVASAPDGTTVVGETGTFTEPVNVTDLHDVTVTASDDATFQPTSTVGVDRGGYGDDRVTAFRVVDSRNVTVTGLDIDFGEIAGENGVGTGSSPVYGVLYWNTSGAFTDSTVRDLAVPETDGGYYEIGFHARAPDRLGDRLNVTVADNEFHELGRVAVNVHEFVRMDIANNTFRSADGDFGYAIELGSEATGAIRQNDIAGFDTSADSDGSQSAGIYVENAFTWDTGDLEKQVFVANNTVRDSQVGVQFGQTYDGYSSDVKIVAQFQDNVVRNNSVAGVIVTDENALAGSAVRVFTEDNTIADNRRGYWVQTEHDASSNGDGDIVVLGRHDTVTGNDVGLLVEQPADADDARYVVQFRYSAFVDNEVAINESTEKMQVEARLNWFGDEDGPSEGDLQGDVAYEPFLTAPPGDVADEPGAVQRFGYDLEVPGDGEAHAVGFPAEVDETFGEVFGDVEHGVVYAYDADSDTWTVPSPDAGVNALDAVVVVAQNRTEYTVSVANAEPSGAPGERELEPGWNFVAAPQHGGAGHAFDAVAGADIERVVEAFEQPEDVPGRMVGDYFGSYTMRDGGHVRVGSGPDVSPFSGYWVFVSDEGTLGGAAYPGLALGDVMQVLTTYEDEERVLGGE